MERIKLTKGSADVIYTTSVDLDDIDTSKHLDIRSFVEDSYVFIFGTYNNDYIAYSIRKLHSIGWSVVGNPIFISKFALMTYLNIANMEFNNEEYYT